MEGMKQIPWNAGKTGKCGTTAVSVEIEVAWDRTTSAWLLHSRIYHCRNVHLSEFFSKQAGISPYASIERMRKCFETWLVIFLFLPSYAKTESFFDLYPSLVLASDKLLFWASLLCFPFFKSAKKAPLALSMSCFSRVLARRFKNAFCSCQEVCLGPPFLSWSLWSDSRLKTYKKRKGHLRRLLEKWNHWCGFKASMLLSVHLSKAVSTWQVHVIGHSLWPRYWLSPLVSALARNASKSTAPWHSIKW